MKLKNIWIYYLLIVTPLASLMLFAAKLESLYFSILLLLYVLVYRTLLDGLRVHARCKIQPKDLWKLYLPFYGHIRYFKALYTSQEL